MESLKKKRNKNFVLGCSFSVVNVERVPSVSRQQHRTTTATTTRRSKRAQEGAGCVVIGGVLVRGRSDCIRRHHPSRYNRRFTPSATRLLFFRFMIITSCLCVCVCVCMRVLCVCVAWCMYLSGYCVKATLWMTLCTLVPLFSPLLSLSFLFIHSILF